MLIALLLASATPVLIIDSVGDQLYSVRDVQIIDVTPTLSSREHRASTSTGRVDHGVAMAEAFVKQYRKLDNSPLVIYTINPYVQRGLGGPIYYSRSVVERGLRNVPANVRVVVTAFGTSKPVDLAFANRVVFAAAPNAKEDLGIWPAADSRNISVASRSIDYSKWSWLNFVTNGDYHVNSVDVSGSSFAAAKLAAAGAFILKKNPNYTTIDVRKSLSCFKHAALSIKVIDSTVCP